MLLLFTVVLLDARREDGTEVAKVRREDDKREEVAETEEYDDDVESASWCFDDAGARTSCRQAWRNTEAAIGWVGEIDLLLELVVTVG